MSQRTERIGDLIRGELAELIRRELRDPRVALATVNRVDVSRDLGLTDHRPACAIAHAHELNAAAGVAGDLERSSAVDVVEERPIAMADLTSSTFMTPFSRASSKPLRRSTTPMARSCGLTRLAGPPSGRWTRRATA